MCDGWSGVECAVIDSVTLVSVLCEHCTAQASPAVQEGDIGLPTSGWQQQGTLDNHPPCGICIPDIAGADPWHWTLDIGFQCRLGKRCCKLARLQWTSHPGISFSQCTEGIMATLEPGDNSNNRQALNKWTSNKILSFNSFPQPV